jgi:hypothetical protein
VKLFFSIMMSTCQQIQPSNIYMILNVRVASLYTLVISFPFPEENQEDETPPLEIFLLQKSQNIVFVPFNNNKWQAVRFQHKLQDASAYIRQVY